MPPRVHAMADAPPDPASYCKTLEGYIATQAATFQSMRPSPWVQGVQPPRPNETFAIVRWTVQRDGDPISLEVWVSRPDVPVEALGGRPAYTSITASLPHEWCTDLPQRARTADDVPGAGETYR